MRRSMILQSSSLSYTEFVLLINYGKAELLKPYALLKNGMCSYDNINCSLSKSVFYLVFVFVCQRSGKQLNAYTKRKEQLR